ncbi:AmmeMemoRadiSam system protein B [Candidatus Dojkabacteria bacterium]|nr:AmmeMemoRadiSam system protein B [Candidatus Dojkabacteria bacterium]
MIRPIVAAPALYPDTGLLEFLRLYESTYLKQIKSKYDLFSKKFVSVKGLIVPHGPYTYTAGVQTVTFGLLSKLLNLKSVTFIFISESETFSNKNIGIYPYTGWETPLGVVQTDNELIYKLSREPGCKIIERFSEKETAIESELPFVQHYFSDINYKIVALAVPKSESYEELTTIIDHFPRETCIPIVCSNVAVGNNTSKVKQIIGIANKFIPMLDTITIQNECDGAFQTGILALMQYARRNRFNLSLIEQACSQDFGDTRNSKEGYSSFFLY